MATLRIPDFIELLQQRRLSQHTLLAYQSDLQLVETHIKKPLIQATEKELFRYFQTLAELKATTVRRRLIALKRFFDYAEKHKLIKEDPAGNLSAPSLPQRLPKYMSEKEVKALMDNLQCQDAQSLRNTTIMKLLYYTGLRIGEVQLLDVEHVLMETRQLKVLGKGDKERLVPMNQTLFYLMEEWLTWRSTLPFVRSSALFISLGKNHRGHRISYGALRHIVKRLMKQAGLAKYSPHKLRHTFATQLLDRGAPLEQISKLLGHSRLDTTLIYAQTEPGKLRSAVELLG